MTAYMDVQFDRPLQEWEGFGCNYVEMSHSRDGAYEDYGSFSEMSEANKNRVLDMIFGADGLRTHVVKMFLSPHLLVEPPQPGVIRLDDYRFDECLPQNIYFAQEGIRRSLEQGITLRFIITMYGPPAWANQQKIIRGRDLNPAMRDSLATYLAGCALYLHARAGIPVEAVSLHNEGEDPNRYPGRPGDDFNMYWSPEQIADMIPRVRQQLDAAGLQAVAVTPGETTFWSRFEPYAWAIGQHERAWQDVGLLTSHGFAGDMGVAGINFLRRNPRGTNARPDLRAWTTSCSWYKSGGVDFASNFVDQVNRIGVNALIPWAIIQTPPKWPGGDPNPNPPFLVEADRSVTVNKSYSYYKQLSRAGQAGMNVVTITGDFYRSIYALAFATGKSTAANALVIVNTAESPRDLKINIQGCGVQFEWFRTDSGAESYTYVGDVTLDGRVHTLPGASVSTFFAK